MAEIIIFIFSGVFIGIAAGLFGLGGGLDDSASRHLLSSLLFQHPV